MKFARNAFITTLTILALIITASAQTQRSEDDPRNIAPSVGTGGPPGGPTGLFTIYDGQTHRKGEYTFSAAYSNFDRDPGDVDITEVPVSFTVGLNDYIELFFSTDAYKAVKVNSPRNLSGFYLPNTQLRVGGVQQSLPAVVLAPQGPGPSQFPNTGVFRPTGTAIFTPFPFTGANAGTFGNTGAITTGQIFGFPGGFALLGPPNAGNGSGAGNFPGVGSIFGSILPGVVLQTALIGTNPAGVTLTEVPTSFTLAPAYLPDAPLLNRTYGETAFNTFNVGAKIRFTGPNNPIGVGVIPFYRFYADNADDFSGFNQLQAGASPGGNNGDFGLVGFADARVRKWMNISGNIGYIYNSDMESGNITLIDRPDELLAGVGVDFPVNKYFQPIVEFRSTKYVGGRTPNAFENDPLEGLAGARFYPTRWLSLGGSYRYHFNAQDRDSFDGDVTFTNNVNVVGAAGQNPFTSTFSGVPNGFRPSTDPHGFLFQATIGRRNPRAPLQEENKFADVTALNVSDATVTTPCPQGSRPVEGSTCSDNMSVDVQTTAVDPENDVLTYEYTVSGGRIVGSGANVSWDLSGVQPGTYTITAGVNDGCGICGETKTQTIKVEACECEKICDCPTGVTVLGPSGTITAGDSATFTASVDGGAGNNNFNWEVNQGTITSGQGTSSITVSTTDGMAGSNLVAKVTVQDADCTECAAQMDDETVPVVPRVIPPIEIDKSGDEAANQTRAKLDAYFVALQNNPNATGYIIIYGDNSREVARRERLIRNHIRFRRAPADRITIVTAPDRGNGIESVYWLVPAGASNPSP